MAEASGEAVLERPMLIHSLTSTGGTPSVRASWEEQVGNTTWAMRFPSYTLWIPLSCHAHYVCGSALYTPCTHKSAHCTPCDATPHVLHCVYRSPCYTHRVRHSHCVHRSTPSDSHGHHSARPTLCAVFTYLVKFHPVVASSRASGKRKQECVLAHLLKNAGPRVSTGVSGSLVT